MSDPQHEHPTRRGRYRRLKKHKARAREVALGNRKRYVVSYRSFIASLFA